MTNMQSLLRMCLCSAVVFVAACVDSGGHRSYAGERRFETVFLVDSEVALRPSSEDPVGVISSMVLWNGALAVADGFQSNVKVFAEDGALLRTIGRAGEGPGEFRHASSIAALSDGRLAVLDTKMMRLSLFDSSGAFVESWNMPVVAPSSIQVGKDGTTLLVAGTMAENGVKNRSEELFHFSAKGKLLRRSTYFDRPARHPLEGSVITPFIATSGKGVVAARMSSNVLTRIDENGRQSEFTVGDGMRTPIEWPASAMTDMARVRAWFSEQTWTRDVVWLGGDWYAVGAQSYTGTEPDPLSYWLAELGVEAGPPKVELLVPSAPYRLHAVAPGAIVGTRVDGEGVVRVARLKFRP